MIRRFTGFRGALLANASSNRSLEKLLIESIRSGLSIACIASPTMQDKIHGLRYGMACIPLQIDDIYVGNEKLIGCKYDIIILYGAIEAVLNPARLLRNVRRLCSSIIISYPIADLFSVDPGLASTEQVNSLYLEELIATSKRCGFAATLFAIDDRNAILRLEKEEVFRPEQAKHDLTTINRVDRSNVGDMFSDPSLYFDDLGHRTRLDIQNIKKPNQILSKNVILGGGGMFNPNFSNGLHNLATSRLSRLIIWGAGENNIANKVDSYVERSPISIPPEIVDRSCLIGIRDYDESFEWAPCPSCMHPIFDRPIQKGDGIGLIEHKEIPIEIEGFPRCSNNKTSLEELVLYLDEFDSIITNSYHAAFWATLRGKRVVCFPFSSKFYGFKHEPALVRPSEWRKGLELAVSYPQSLGECRSATRQFYKKVQEVISQ